MYPLKSRFRLHTASLASGLSLLLAALCLFSCKHTGRGGGGEIMYVSAPQANLRDHLAAIYNRVGSVKNGDRVEVLERQKRFVRVRTDQKVEGWIELRALVPRETFEQFQQLSQENRDTPVQGHGITRVELNMHVAPGRETDTLYQLPEAAKVEMLKRSTAPRATPEEIAAKRAAELARAAGEPVKPAPKRHSAASSPTQPTKTQPTKSRSTKTPSKQAEPSATNAATNAATQAAPKPTQPASSSSTPPPATQSNPSALNSAQEATPTPMDDWWLVRDQQGRTGWVLARMVDLDIPLDVAQYAEGQRIQAAFVLNTVQDEEKGAVAQYLVLLNENRDGIAYDFNQVRVFTWNLKRHRYETGYRDHYIVGYFPALVSTEDFGREGVMPVFTIRKQNEDGSISPRKYRIIGNVVRPVLAPGEEVQRAAHSPGEPKKGLLAAKKSRGARRANHGRKH